MTLLMTKLSVLCYTELFRQATVLKVASLRLGQLKCNRYEQAKTSF